MWGERSKNKNKNKAESYVTLKHAWFFLFCSGLTSAPPHDFSLCRYWFGRARTAELGIRHPRRVFPAPGALSRPQPRHLSSPHIQHHSARSPFTRSGSRSSPHVTPCTVSLPLSPSSVLSFVLSFQPMLMNFTCVCRLVQLMCVCVTQTMSTWNRRGLIFSTVKIRKFDNRAEPSFVFPSHAVVRQVDVSIIKVAETEI